MPNAHFDVGINPNHHENQDMGGNSFCFILHIRFFGNGIKQLIINSENKKIKEGYEQRKSYTCHHDFINIMFQNFLSV